MKKRLKLRALRLEDAEVTLTWRNREDIRDRYSGHPFPVNYEMEKSWLEKVSRSNIPTTVLGVEELSSHKLIGLADLRNINFINREAESGMLIGDKEQQGKGYGEEATLLILDFAFRQLGLNRVFVKVIVENAPAIRVLAKCGFQEEGRLRESVFKNGRFKDQLLMSILSREFRHEEDDD